MVHRHDARRFRRLLGPGRLARGALDHLRALSCAAALAAAVPAGADTLTVLVEGAPVVATINSMGPTGVANITYEWQGESVTASRQFALDGSALAALLKENCERPATRYVRGLASGILWTDQTSAERARVLTSLAGHPAATGAVNCQYNSGGATIASIQLNAWFPVGNGGTHYDLYVNLETPVTASEAAILYPSPKYTITASTAYSKSTGAAPASLYGQCYSPYTAGLNRTYSQIYLRVPAQAKSCAAAVDEGLALVNYQGEPFSTMWGLMAWAPGELDRVYLDAVAVPAEDCPLCSFNFTPDPEPEPDPGGGGGGGEVVEGVGTPGAYSDGSGAPGTGYGWDGPVGNPTWDPAPEGSEPGACDPALEVCNFRVGEGPAIPELGIELGLSFGSGWLPRACPPPVSVSVPILGVELSYDLAPLCAWLPLFAAFLKVVAVMAALGIVFGSGGAKE